MAIDMCNTRSSALSCHPDWGLVELTPSLKIALELSLINLKTILPIYILYFKHKCFKTHFTYIFYEHIYGNPLVIGSS